MFYVTETSTDTFAKKIVREKAARDFTAGGLGLSKSMRARGRYPNAASSTEPSSNRAQTSATTRRNSLRASTRRRPAAFSRGFIAPPPSRSGGRVRARRARCRKK